MVEGVVTSWVKETRKNSGWLIVIGALNAIVGFMAIGSPMVAGMSVAVLVGILLLIAGFFQIIGSLKAGSFGAGGLGFIGGLLTTLAGFLMFTHPLFGIGVLAVFIGIYFFFDGIWEIGLAFKIKPEKGWGWILVSGILSIFLGFFIFRQWPVSGALAIGTLVGIHLIFRGVSLVAIGATTRSELSRINRAI